ncbi:MAG: phosphatidylinositol transfer protein [Polyangiaceae bacterium]
MRTPLCWVKTTLGATSFVAAIALTACEDGGAITSSSGMGGSSPVTASGTSGTSDAASSGAQGSTSSTSTSGSGSGGAGGVPGAWCGPIPACDAAAPAGNDPTDSPNHRGRDLFLNPGDPQWILAKFTWGSLADFDYHGEDVDIYLNRDCGTQWEWLGTAVTTNDGDHATVEGVEDTGGRVYFQIPADKEVGLGRHRVRLVMKSDNSSTELFIEVVPKGTPVFVSDVDGTLTTDEYAQVGALFTGTLPDSHPFAAEVFQKLVAKGYHPFYLTARPEVLGQSTRDFLSQRGFPAGIAHTTLTKSGATGAEAATFKSNELAMLAQKGMLPTYGFGNTASDAQAYENASISPVDRRVFYQFDDTSFGGRRIESYEELKAEVDALPNLCAGP